MSTYRNELPQLTAGVFLADGGIETTLIYDDGFDLPDFAAFPLLDDRRRAGRPAALLRRLPRRRRPRRRGHRARHADLAGLARLGRPQLRTPSERLIELHQVAVDLLEAAGPLGATRRPGRHQRLHRAPR